MLSCVWVLVSPCVGSAETVGHYFSAITTPAQFANQALTAQRNSYIDLQPWEAGKAAELKAANPNLKVLVYQNVAGMTQGVGPRGTSSSGVNYAEANTAHPDWFLKGSNGERLAFEDFNYMWAADVGNPEYQHLWAANVIRVLNSGPWDGVLMDDTNTTMRYHFNPASKLAQYPTDSAYQKAVRSMLEYVGPAIQAAGKLALPNVGSWSEYPAVVREWLPFVSGGMDEMFVKWSLSAGQGYRGSHEWETQVGEIATTEAMGKHFIALTQAEPSDILGARYGWASALLAGNGHTVFKASNGHTGEETWLGDYETELGAPTANAAAIGNGAWQRPFANGLVVVNPTTSSVSVNFGGTYSGDGLNNATGATLGPHGAVVLTRGAPKSGHGGSEGGSGPKGPGPAGTESTGAGTTLVVSNPSAALLQAAVTSPLATATHAKAAPRHSSHSKVTSSRSRRARCRHVTAARRRSRAGLTHAVCRVRTHAPGHQGRRTIHAVGRPSAQSKRV
jgi:Hypothetical glycosyl hydrolase family 15